MRHRIMMKAAAGLLAIVVVAGCSQESKEHYGLAGDSAKTAVKQVGTGFGDDVRDESKWSEQAAGRTGKAAERFAGNAVQVADNDQNSMAVKAALMQAKDMPTGKLRVDTRGKKVILRGRVPTSDQRQRAEQITKNVLGSGYTIVNQLTVGG